VAIELATAYVSLVPETSKLEKGIKDAFNGVGKQAEAAGQEMGSRLARTASKALKDGWRPDQDIMAGIPNTKLDRVGARIGQVIGKGVAGGLKARQIGQDFGKSFASGAGSIGIGSVISGWRSDLAGQSNKLGFMAGRALSAGLTAAVGVGVAGVGVALKTGFDRLVSLDTAQYKLKQILKSSGRDAKEFDKINKAIQNSVDKTPFSLDQAFGTAVQAIGAGVQDIEKFMTNVADAAGFAGTDLERMGLIFNQVLAKGKLTGEETMQLMEAGLPARSWIQKSYDLTAEQFDSMQQKGEISLDMLQKSIEDHAPGMAKALGDTLQGSIDNMQTSLARLGANFLSAVFGGESGDATEGLKDSVKKITEYLNQMSNWVNVHRDDIREFFNNAVDAAKGLGRVLGDILGFLKEHPGAIEAVVVAFVAWKSITGIAAVATAVSGLNVALGSTATLATAAYAPLAAIAAIIAGGAIGAATLDNAINAYGADSEAGQNALNQATAPGMGVPGASRDPIFGTGPNIPGGGGPGASRQRRGLPPLSVGGGGSFGTAGRGYFNSRAAAQRLDDQLLLSNVPSGSYSQTSSADLTQGLGDCTSAIEDLVNIIDGQSTAGRSMSTGNAHEWLSSRGFQPGTAPGAFNVGFNSGHMQATLPGGTPFNWGSNASAANRGIGGSGAFDPALTNRYYRYDTGGWLPPGDTMVQNDTGKPELILNPEQQKNLADSGVDPNSLLHGNAGGAQPGPAVERGPAPDSAEGNLLRTAGFIPVSAGNTGVAGTSSLAGYLNMGNQVIGGLIDTGVSLAQMAASAGIAAGTMGGSLAAGPAAGAAAGYGIQLAGATAKRGVAYGFQMASILGDSIIEQLTPFGAPRWLGYDYTSFSPNLGISEALTTSVEKMGGDAIQKHFGQNPESPSGPVQPNQMSGMQAPTPPPGTDPFGTSGGGGPAPSPTETSGPSSAPPPPNDLLGNMFGVYDQGGMLPPGGVGINMTNRPEPVLTPQQWEAIVSSSSAPSQGAPLVQNLYAQDMQDAIRQLDKVKRRDMMQYAGRP
jgi:tape measure domain-containing protein